MVVSAVQHVPEAPSRPRGRPRSAAAEAAIFEAVFRMLERGARLGDLSMDRIAQEAGVGKATLYRRWPNRDALLLDVVQRLDEPDREAEPPAGGVRGELVALVEDFRRRGLARRSRGLLSLVVGEMMTSPQLWALYRERVISRRKEALRRALARGVERGEIRGDVDLELLGQLVIGPILIRALLDDSSPLDDPRLPELIVDTALAGVAAPRA